MIASLKNYRISPRKFRLVATMVKGKSAIQAKAILDSANKKARHPLSVLLDSAIANAVQNQKAEAKDLFIKELRVDQGRTLKRQMPMARGSAFPIKKRTSNVSLVLEKK